MQYLQMTLPPSENEVGVHIHKFAVVAAGSIVMPGIEIESDSLVAAGAIVTKDVKQGTVVGGNPAKVISTVERIKTVSYTHLDVYKRQLMMHYMTNTF